MPSSINLQRLRSQQLAINLEGVQHSIRVYETNNGMAVDLERDGNLVFNGLRLVNGELLIPFEYLEFGNFLLISTDNCLADYRNFGETQNLIYFTASELAVL